jgi:hypothetical protein
MRTSPQRPFPPLFLLLPLFIPTYWVLPVVKCSSEEPQSSREIAPFINRPQELPAAIPSSDDKLQVNVSVILPFEHFYQSSFKRVGPAILLAFEAVRHQLILPHHRIKLSYYDSQCSNVLAPMYATRATMVEGHVHVFFGPACELALGMFFHFIIHSFSMIERKESLKTSNKFFG